jgi:signal transduction histidine kinase
MFDWLDWLFDSRPFVPRTQCGGWSEELMWVTIASDALIWLAYMAIPLLLFWVGRKRPDFPHRRMIWLFVAFIVSCGFTHLVDVFTFYDPHYRLGAAVRALTASASWATVIALVPITPKLLSMRSPADLEREIDQRRIAEDKLRQANESLEARVRERTAELEQANAALALENEQRRRVEEELRHKARELEAISHETESFASVASHELQEPLRKITGFAQLVEEHLGDRLDAEGKDYLRRMVRAAERMNLMVKELLQLSRAGGEPLHKQPVNLSRAVERIRVDLESAINEAGAEIVVGDLPTVTATPVQVDQVLLNLIGNALKYRAKDRRLRVEIFAEPVGPGVTRVTVKDNGIGFAPAHTPRIFKPFQRLHSQADYPGTGMGLAICRKIIERHGGTIGADSEPGKGSSFYFTLPTNA